MTRKRDEAIVIAGNITVKVLSVQGNRVRLGIEAPPEVDISRPQREETAHSVIVRRPRFMVEHAPVGADY